MKELLPNDLIKMLLWKLGSGRLDLELRKVKTSCLDQVHLILHTIFSPLSAIVLCSHHHVRLDASEILRTVVLSKIRIFMCSKL